MDRVARRTEQSEVAISREGLTENLTLAEKEERGAMAVPRLVDMGDEGEGRGMSETSAKAATRFSPSTLSPLLLCHRRFLSFSYPMAARYPGDGATANGFGRRHVREDEACLLYEAEYPTPPDMRVPGLGGSVPVPPPPTEA
ncbi:hypothetical protein D1007_40339 [Hordeum vulgare]|nr:hypothetical protein D1007_40339 [Hordeum vulgare]